MTEYVTKWTTLIIPWLLNHGLKILVLIIGTLIINKIAQKFIERSVRIMVVADKNAPANAEIQRENTLIQIFSATFKIALMTITLLMILKEFGLEIGPILAAAGIVGLAFGFGGQYLIRDIISGLFIILENQYRIGDVVDFDSASGAVEQISLRKTTLRDMDGTVHHIPHGEIKRVSNLTKDFSRVNLNLGISYAADLEHVISVVNKVGNAIAEDPKYKEYIVTAPQFLRVDEFAASSIIIKILGDTVPLKQWEISGELRKRIKIAFDREEIDLPYPQMVVHQAKVPNKLKEIPA